GKSCGNGCTGKGQGKYGFTKQHDQTPLISIARYRPKHLGQLRCKLCITVLNVETQVRHRPDPQITNTLCSTEACFEKAAPSLRSINARCDDLKLFFYHTGGFRFPAPMIQLQPQIQSLNQKLRGNPCTTQLLC
ncbi:MULTISPECIES: hypothetical protein, partial [unclassified Polaromonas]|uniref:hypothetical protein n=1 Tax=unclassified Polaromonas TaxID=2638319 RepID=UPI0025EBD7E6